VHGSRGTVIQHSLQASVKYKPASSIAIVVVMVTDDYQPSAANLRGKRAGLDKDEHERDLNLTSKSESSNAQAN